MRLTLTVISGILLHCLSCMSLLSTTPLEFYIDFVEAFYKAICGVYMAVCILESLNVKWTLVEESCLG